MKVSIIIPVYNVEKYLDDCMISAVNQTLDNIEIIAVNDGSTDNSLSILQDYAEKYNFIKIINQENKGLGNARNNAMRIAKGEYVYFLDSDDYIELNCLEICYNDAINNDLDMVCFDARCFYDEEFSGRYNMNYDRTNIIESKVMSGEDYYIYFNENKVYESPVWLNLYRLNYLKRNNLYFKEGILHEDETHTSQSLINAQKVKYIPKTLFNRRIRNNSIMTSGITENRIDGNLFAAEETYNFYKNNNFKERTNTFLLIWIHIYFKNSLIFSDSLGLYKKRKYIEHKILSKKELLNMDMKILIETPQLYYNRELLIKENSNYLLEYKDNKKIFYMITPIHGNLGDQAISYTSLTYLKENYPEYKIIEIDFENVTKDYEKIKSVITSEDLIFIHGGGNMGNLYIWEEEARRFVINNFKNIPIISFPQTMYFTEDNEGQKELLLSKEIYNRHNNLTLIAREERTYNLMKEHFYNCNIIICPDIVYYLNKRISIDTQQCASLDREYIMTCFRNDKETFFSLDDKEMMINKLKREFKVKQIDTVINERVDSNNREEKLLKLWEHFYTAKVVITDRLHGMIFCVITKTPCIVIRSKDYKIIDSYKWIENLNYIRLIDNLDIDKVKDLIIELSNIKIYDDIDFNQSYFYNLRYFIENKSGNYIDVLSRETNVININNIKINNNKVYCSMEISNNIKKYFNYSNMTVEYETDIYGVPDGIAVIPLLSNILPIAWFTDSEIRLNELDETFYLSIEEIKNEYEKLYKLKLGGRIIVKNIVDYTYESINDHAVFFSGGVDSLSTTISNLEKEPSLITIWGSDIMVNNYAGWYAVKREVQSFGNMFNLNNIFIKSDFRLFINEIELTKLSKEITTKKWWLGIQHGIGIISLSAPLAYKKKLRRLYLASTLCSKEELYQNASYPDIINNYKFAGCEVINDGFDNNRIDKINIISEYSRDNNISVPIRVCWVSQDGRNCSLCEKCARTIMSLIACKCDPNLFGFYVDINTLDYIKNELINKWMDISYVKREWSPIYKAFLLEKEYWMNYKSINWIMDLNFRDN